MTPTARPILLDCDPGIDDAIALADLFARRTRGDIVLTGIVVTAGNMDLPTELRNTRAWRALAAQVDPSAAAVPIHAGAATQRVHAHGITPDTHGPGGAGWARFAAEPCPADSATGTDSVPADDSGLSAGARAWIELSHEFTGRLEAVAVGPLTTLAEAIDADPRLPQRLASLTIMGGTFCGYPGNTTAVAEWNFHTDPEAAEHVLTACAAAEGLTVRICGQNLTDQAQITPAQVTAMREEDRREITQELARALDFYIDFHERVGEGSHAKVHDLAALTLGLEPERAHWTPAQVHVACEDPFTRGMSVAEMRPERFERGRTSVLIATGMARGAAPDMLSDWVARHLAWRTEQSPRTWS